MTIEASIISSYMAPKAMLRIFPFYNELWLHKSTNLQPKWSVAPEWAIAGTKRDSCGVNVIATATQMRLHAYAVDLYRENKNKQTRAPNEICKHAEQSQHMQEEDKW